MAEARPCGGFSFVRVGAASTGRIKSCHGDYGGAVFAIGADWRRVKPSSALLDERGDQVRQHLAAPDHNVKGTHIMAESIIPQAETQSPNLDDMDEEQFGELMLARLRAAPALLDKSQVYAIESNIQGDVNRRAAFAIASVAGDDLIEKISADREFAVVVGSVFNSLDKVKARYQELLDLFETLQARLAVAVAVREDMEEILAESRTEPLH